MTEHLRPALKHADDLIRQAKRELALAQQTGKHDRIVHAFHRLQKARVEASSVRRYRRQVRDDVFRFAGEGVVPC